MGQNGAQIQRTAKELHREAAEKLFSMPLCTDPTASLGAREDSFGGTSDADDTVPLEDVNNSELAWDTVSTPPNTLTRPHGYTSPPAEGEPTLRDIFTG